MPSELIRGMRAETPPELLRKIEKLNKINAVLMDRVEQSMDRQGNAFSLFQTAIMLEAQVRARTEELTQVLRKLERTNAQLSAAKEEADNANLSKTRFLAAASHDLLQPVMSAKLSILALANLQHSQEGGRLARQAEGSLQTIEDLIKTLLDISKLDAGVVTPEIRRFPLDALLEGLHATFESSLPLEGSRLKVRPSGLIVESDPVLLQRVLLNLVSNAIHYTRTGGVLVGVRRRGAACYLDVTDTGAGIPECEQQRIFDEFYRGSSSSNGNRTGLGLGLSIVKRITQALGHELSLKSVAGRGSRFRIALPVAGAAGAQALASPGLDAAGPARWRDRSDRRERTSRRESHAAALRAVGVPDDAGLRSFRSGQPPEPYGPPPRYRGCRLPSGRKRFGRFSDSGCPGYRSRHSRSRDYGRPHGRRGQGRPRRRRNAPA